MGPVLLVLPLVGAYDEALLLSLQTVHVPRLAGVSVAPRERLVAYPFQRTIDRDQRTNGWLWVGERCGQQLFPSSAPLAECEGEALLERSWVPPLDLFAARAVVYPKTERLFRVHSGASLEGGTGFYPLLVETTDEGFRCEHSTALSFSDPDGGLRAELEALEQSERALYDHLFQMGRLLVSL